MSRIMKATFIQAACALSLAACTKSNNIAAPESEQSAKDLVAQRDTKWSSTNIPVCFVNMSGTEQLAVEAKKLAVSEYAKAGICLTGWKQCSESTPCPAIHIDISEQDSPWGGWSYVGPQDQLCSPTEKTIWLAPAYINSSVVHEIGHSIGFLHEHEREDNHSECGSTTKGLSQSDGSLVFLTSYDEQSVMSYCSEHVRLSATDVEGIRKFYGVSETATCEDNDSGNSNNGGANGNDSGACVDGDTSCGYWAGLGYCATSSIYNPYMTSNCCSSCKEWSNACVDGDTSCGYWAGLGYCAASSIYNPYMTSNCCRSCKEWSNACVDDNASCGYWAGLGYCEASSIYNPYMTSHCCNSCR